MKELKAEATIFTNDTNKLTANSVLYPGPLHNSGIIKENKVIGKLFLSEKMLDNIATCEKTIKQWKADGVSVEKIVLFCDNANGYMETDDGKAVLSGIDISFYYGGDEPSILRVVDVIYKNNLEGFIF